MIKWTKSLLLTVGILGLLATNILTLTNAALNSALSGLIGSALAKQTVSEKLRRKVDSQGKTIARQRNTAIKRTEAAKKFGTRFINRTKRVAVKSVAALPAESIPFIGVAVLIADTGYELYAACETVRDLDQLYTDLGIKDEMPEDAMHAICQPDLPSADQVWDGVLKSIDQWWMTLLEAT